MPRLTKRFVDGLRPQEKDRFYWDAELPGFGIRVWPSGRKVYMAQYRADGRTRRVKIGVHGAVTAEQARKSAQSLLGDVARGANPAEDKATGRKALTVSDLCDMYMGAAGEGLILGKRNRPKKQSTLATDRGRITRHIKPLLGTRLVTEIIQPDINRFIRDVSLGKTAVTVKTGNKRGKAVVTGGPGTAARTTGLLGGIFSYAVSEGLIPINPVRGVKRPAGNPRKRRLSEEEFGRLGQALVEAEREGETWQALAAIRFLVLTGFRSSEILELTWSEIDTDGHCIRLDDSKEDASTRAVGQPVLDLLTGITPHPQLDLVVTGIRRVGPYGSLPRAWDRITKRAGLDSDITPHTLRHSFSSVAADLGYVESTIAACIGQSSGTVTSRYIHHLDSVLIAAADTISARIQSLMSR